MKQGIADRARAHAAEGTDHRSNPYRDLSKEESDRRAAAGEPFAVRLKVAQDGKTHFDDLVYGAQERNYSEIEDLVLLRSDGHPALQPFRRHRRHRNGNHACNSRAGSRYQHA